MANGQSSTPTSQAMQQTNTKSNQDEEDKRRAERKKTVQIVAVCCSVAFSCICLGWLFHWLTCTKVNNICNEAKKAVKLAATTHGDDLTFKLAEGMPKEVNKMSLIQSSFRWAGIGTALPPFGLYNIINYIQACTLNKKMTEVMKAVKYPMDHKFTRRDISI